MITDHEINFLYLSDLLPIEHPEFFKRFEAVLKECNIPFAFLPGTKDIWAKDFMPVQTRVDEFIQFRYEPDYLMDTPENRATISDVDAICKAIGIKPIRSEINLDGGNVTKWKDRAILCEKVFEENPGLHVDELLEELMEHFNLKEENLFFVPWDEGDFSGHADGMLRFIDADHLLINDYRKESRDFQMDFHRALDYIDLEWTELPYEPENDPKELSAVGLYLNYLQMEQAIIVPTFNLPADEKALGIIREAFPGQTVRSIDCVELARLGGGILNCISWNIRV